MMKRIRSVNNSTLLAKKLGFSRLRCAKIVGHKRNLVNYKQVLIAFLLSFFPLLASAASNSSLSFAPPPSDLSVVFLGNLFGIVDGVLSGTGSQILGTMFGVFNSAVLALGGVVIIYTLIVSTMNTAESGKMLGEKWSSIWVPLRATLGLALLIPKASGYCLMQIFVMWVVVQGVGAADKIWSAALGYLNRGGLIVQTQMVPAESLLAGGSSVAVGASTILAGQVCMVGLQSILETQRQTYLTAQQNNAGPCYGSPSPTMQDFCTTPVPDFLSSVNAVSMQNMEANPENGVYSVQMPNFPATSIYASLNGICGTLKWNQFSQSQVDTITGYTNTLSQNEVDTAKMSRAIAIQQMYADLSPVAQVMVNNYPHPQNTSSDNYSQVAVDQFGVPYLSSGQACTTVTPSCNQWGQDPKSNSKSAPLFNGTEFQGAIADYNGIMLPTLNLYNEAKNQQGQNNYRGFIQQANDNGWMLAGSYFFDLAQLNAQGISSSNLTDQDSGLDGSSFDTNSLTEAFTSNGCSTNYANLCYWLSQTTQITVPAQINGLIGLINGYGMLSAPLSTPTKSTLNPSSPDYSSETGLQSSTVYGFINNSMMITLPGQPGQAPPPFQMRFNFKPNIGQFKLPPIDFPCGQVVITFFSFCLGQLLGNIFYNMILVTLLNFLLSILAPIVNGIVIILLSAPLEAIGQYFLINVALIQQPSVNPIIALANMGVSYINFSSELWIMFIGFFGLTSIFLAPLVPLLALIFPLLIVWLGIMVGIGVITAYYIPFVPYMIFTFGSIAWLMAVIEAMVAAPIVALGVTHPEGHEAFGKGEHAVMILLNVFLRPSMMIIGFIAGISLSYVSVWVINAGFANAQAFIQGTATGSTFNVSVSSNWSAGQNWNTRKQNLQAEQGNAPPPPANPNALNEANSFTSMSTGYTGWAGIYGFFFCVLIYTAMYLLVVQKAFNLIAILPDKVLRWIGGSPEQYGEQAGQWVEEPHRQVSDAGKDTMKAASARDKQLEAWAIKKGGALKGKQSSVSGTGVDSTPDSTPS